VVTCQPINLRSTDLLWRQDLLKEEMLEVAVEWLNPEKKIVQLHTCA